MLVRRPMVEDPCFKGPNVVKKTEIMAEILLPSVVSRNKTRPTEPIERMEQWTPLIFFKEGGAKQ